MLKSCTKWMLNCLLAGLFIVSVYGCASKKVAVQAEPEPEAQPQEVVKEPEKPLAFDMVRFAYNQAALSATAKKNLKAAADLLLAKPDVKINVNGHCDERGTDDYNIELGWKRAYAARDYLKKLGIDDSRIYPTSYGRARPLVIGNDESAWSKNRRVEISVR